MTRRAVYLEEVIAIPFFGCQDVFIASQVLVEP